MKYLKLLPSLTFFPLVFLTLACSPRPTLQGRPVANWLERLQPSAPDAQRRQAAAALGDFIRATPAGQYGDPGVIKALDTALTDRNPDVRLDAALALAWAGCDRGLTVPVLVEAMRDHGIPALHQTIGQALLYRDRDTDLSLAALQKVAEKRLPDFPSLDVTSSTGRTQAQIQQSVAALTAQLASPAEPAVLASLAELGHLGLDAVPAIPAIQALAQKNAPRLQVAAIQALDRLGILANAALRDIAYMLSGARDPAVRIAAAHAILHLDPNTGGSVFYLHTALAKDGDPRVREAAAAALGDYGPMAKEIRDAAIPPELMKAVFWPRTLAIRVITPAIGPLVAALKDADPRVRAAAARTLGRVAPSTDKVLPALLAATGDAEAQVRAAAAWALGELPAATPAAAGKLLILLKDSSAAVRAEALVARVRTARSDAPLLPLLEAAAADPAPEMQQALLRALAEVGPALVWGSKPLEAALPALLEKHPDPEVRAAAAPVVARAELHTGRALQALTRALADPDRRVALAAALALGWLGPAADGSVPALEKLAHTPAAPGARDAALALGWIDHQSTETLHRLVREMRAPGFWCSAADAPTSAPERWREALLILGWRGPEAWPAAPLAAGLLRDRHNPSEVQLLAGMALTAMSSQTLDGNLPPLFREVAARYHDRQLQAATALIWLGERAAPAFPELLRVLQTRNSDEDLRVAAAAAIGRLGTSAAGRVQDLCDVMRTEASPRVKAAVAAILGGLGAGGRTATPPLIAALRDPDAGVREAAALALGKIALDGPFAVPALGKTLADAEPRVRLAAAMALGGYGPAARETQAALQTLANGDADQLVRKAASVSLKRILGE